MALEEHDREDLLRDAVAMPERGECEAPGATVFCGFRPAGEASFYFGADPVYQFDAAGRLRRAYVDGERMAVGQGRLVALRPEQRGGRVRLSRQPLEPAAQGALLEAAEQRLGGFERALRAGALRWRGTTTDVADFEARLTAWFDRLPRPLRPAAAARLRRQPER